MGDDRTIIESHKRSQYSPTLERQEATFKYDTTGSRYVHFMSISWANSWLWEEIKP